MKYSLTFADPEAVRGELTGGKGANLAWLTQHGFPVPPGVVVTAPAYRAFIAAGQAQVEEFLATAGEQDPGGALGLRESSERLRAELGQLPLPPEVEAELAGQLAAFPAGTAFSVRSSSTLEDLASAAFAGQHETYLNITGLPAILGRIRDCYLSLWADRAVAYRRQQGFDHGLAAMAVVVQQMVPAESAGVGFSLNPVSGRLDELMFNANFGLGESVVSGEGGVDQWLVDKATRAIKSANLARKDRRTVTTATGTTEAHVEETEALRPSLTDAQLRELAELLVRVEQAYRFPQDIEWAFAGGTLHLLQSRPITTIPARWTRDESAERFPNLIAPLTWDFVESGFHRSLNHSFRLLGFPPFPGKWFGMHGHYIYGNQNAVELYGRRAPFQVRSVVELRALLPKLRTEFAWVQELPVQWMRDLDHYLISLGRFQAEPLGGLSDREVWAHIRAVNELGAQYFLPNIAISIAHGTVYRTLHGLLRLVIGVEEADGLFDHLMAFCETKTGQINKELFELAGLVRRTPGLAEGWAAAGCRDWWETGGAEAFPEFRLRLERFLRDHGHREIEFDAYVPTWVEAPWVVLDTVSLIAQSARENTPAEQERALKVRAQQAEVRLFGLLPEDLHFLFHELIRLARTYTSLDDLEHYQTTRLTLPLRRGLRELGGRWVTRGILVDPMDLFFTHPEQVEAALAADEPVAWATLAEQVGTQKAAYLADRARTPEWILGEPAEAPGEGEELGGLAGSPGVAEGPVFLVLDAADFGKFPQGAVLVARTTNPTWTPLFYHAAAVVTESGGPLSHGAVTAREMRIPAVMSVRGCLQRLRNGQRVRVDGSRGKVWVLEP